MAEPSPTAAPARARGAGIAAVVVRQARVGARGFRWPFIRVILVALFLYLLSQDWPPEVVAYRSSPRPSLLHSTRLHFGLMLFAVAGMEAVSGGVALAQDAARSHETNARDLLTLAGVRSGSLRFGLVSVQLGKSLLALLMVVPLYLLVRSAIGLPHVEFVRQLLVLAAGMLGLYVAIASIAAQGVGPLGSVLGGWLWLAATWGAGPYFHGIFLRAAEPLLQSSPAVAFAHPVEPLAPALLAQLAGLVVVLMMRERQQSAVGRSGLAVAFVAGVVMAVWGDAVAAVAFVAGLVTTITAYGLGAARSDDGVGRKGQLPNRYRWSALTERWQGRADASRPSPGPVADEVGRAPIFWRETRTAAYGGLRRSIRMGYGLLWIVVATGLLLGRVRVVRFASLWFIVLSYTLVVVVLVASASGGAERSANQVDLLRLTPTRRIRVVGAKLMAVAYHAAPGLVVGVAFLAVAFAFLHGREPPDSSVVPYVARAVGLLAWFGAVGGCAALFCLGASSGSSSGSAPRSRTADSLLGLALVALFWVLIPALVLFSSGARPVVVDVISPWLARGSWKADAAPIALVASTVLYGCGALLALGVLLRADQGRSRGAGEERAMPTATSTATTTPGSHP